MSTTMQAIDAKGYLSGWSQALVHMISADINAIPDDKWTATFGGCTRPASALMGDALALMIWTTNALRGNVASDYGPEYMDRVSAECATKTGATAKLKSAVDDFCAALGQASDDALNANVTPPWQMEAPLFMIAQIAVSHLWYHDGQLNYIQCLLGDDKVHWMGD